MNDKPKRRWFQISLRTLLLLVTVASATFGWLRLKVRQAHRQRKAVEAIKELGGEVYYDYEIDADASLIKSARPPGPIWLRSLLGDELFANVTEAYLIGSSFTDSELVHLQSLPRLKKLWFLTDQVSDAGLVHVARSSQLEELHFVNSNITDDGLVHIRSLTKLEHLYLNGTKITDTGLVHLEGLQKLIDLKLFGARVTDDGVKKLQKALPKLKVVR